MHDVAHPQLAGVAEGEAAAVGAVRGLLVEQAPAAEEPMHGRGGERVIDAAVSSCPDDGAHRPGGVVGLERNEALGDLGRQAAGLSPVGARLGVEGLEAAVAVEPDPPPDGFGGDVGPVASGDGVGLAGLVAHLVNHPLCSQRQMHQVGDHAVSGRARSPGEGRRLSCSLCGPRSWSPRPRER